jgi:hypothetical protein
VAHTKINENMPQWQLAQLGHGGISYSPPEMRLRRPNLFAVSDDAALLAGDLISACDGFISPSYFDKIPDSEIARSGFYVYFTRAEWALPVLSKIVRVGGIFAPPPYFNKIPFHLVSAYALDSYNEAGERLGHEPYVGLEVSAQLCQAAELTRDVSGDFVEIGVFSGSSAVVAMLHMRNLGTRRRCWLLDTYSGFDYQAARESPDIIWTGTHSHAEGNMERIAGLTAELGHEAKVQELEIIGGDLPADIEQIAFANIDVDIYEAILSGLHKVGERMAHRGIIVLEDATSLPALYGAYLAQDEFLKSPLGRKFMCIRTTTQYFVVRVER